MIKISEGLRNLAISTLITVGVWIGYEIYKTYNDNSIPENYESLAKPIDTNIDLDFLQQLSSKDFD